MTCWARNVALCLGVIFSSAVAIESLSAQAPNRQAPKRIFKPKRSPDADRGGGRDRGDGDYSRGGDRWGGRYPGRGYPGLGGHSGYDRSSWLYGDPWYGVPYPNYPVAPAYGWGVVPPFGAWPATPPYLPPVMRPSQSILVDSEVIANDPLPPVQVRLLSSAPRDVEVGIVDLANPEGTQSIRLRPGESIDVSLQRDAGATRIQRYQTYDAFGLPVIHEQVTTITPSIRYEIVVHEWAVQSVAIDRTGKSPEVIEDINFQGRGIGRFPLPAGDQLQGGQIDVYRAALAAQNQGTIAPLVPQDPQGRSTDNASKLEQAILEAQRRAMDQVRP